MYTSCKKHSKKHSKRDDKMSLMNNFTYLSKRQREEQKLLFKESIFHLGDGHKEMIELYIKKIVSEQKPKYDPVFLFYNLKSHYIDNGNSFSNKYGSLDWVQKWFKKTLMYPQDKFMLLSYVQLDSLCKSIGEYPTFDEIQNNVEIVKKQVQIP